LRSYEYEHHQAEEAPRWAGRANDFIEYFDEISSKFLVAPRKGVWSQLGSEFCPSPPVILLERNEEKLAVSLQSFYQFLRPEAFLSSCQ
jgi:hypothetical protein